MGKRLIQQRRGRGTPRYRSPSHNFIDKIFHRSYDELERKGQIKGKVLDIINCKGHSAPLAVIEYENGDFNMMFAPEGTYTGMEVISGVTAEPKEGNTIILKNSKIGTQVFNIESKTGDGGKFVRSAGTFATVVGKTKNKVSLKMPSKTNKEFDQNCRAAVGIISGGGRKEKPILKAGKKHFIMKSKNKLFPKTSGVAMNAVDHPFGSGRGRHIGKAKTVSRHAPPGRKVGSVSSRRTGKK